MAKTTCSRCGKTVYRSNSSRPEITCHECRRQQSVPHGKREGWTPKYLPIPCAECGETFQPKPKMKGRPPQRYCSLPCAAKANNRARRAGKPRAPKSNRAASVAARRRRRMRHQGTWDGITDQQILERDRWMCWLCKRRIGKTFKYPHPRSASIDHIVPLSRGGDDTAFNKKAAHLRCNMARGTGKLGEQLTLDFLTAAPVERRKPVRKPRPPRPCRTCGELVKGTCSLHEPVRYGECERCSAPMIKRGRMICQVCASCTADGCTASGGFGLGYCAPHYHRFNRYGDVFSDIPLAQEGRLSKYEVAQLIRLRLAQDGRPRQDGVAA